MIDIKGGWKETTALMEASDKAHGKIVELLLDRGADVDVRSNIVYTKEWQAINIRLTLI